MSGRWSWIGLAIVLLCCCAPLFIGLGAADLENDEAIYSFAVDRILDSGDWLTPKSSPSDTEPFLEKPPLKMWMAAAPIRLGVVQHDEFGLRVTDAVMSGVAFMYVYAIAASMSGAVGVVGGVAAVLILFVHWPLMMAHGLRTNNMEAALVLSYAGGIYHFLRWARAPAPRARWLNGLAVSLYFVLGFMTKFVAAIFLPAILVVSLVLSAPVRRTALRDWRMWLSTSVLALVLIAPWFVYEHLKYGDRFWQTIVGLHVYQRFTASVDPTHLQPWTFYFARIYEWFHFSGTFALIAAGSGLLVFRAVARRDFDAAVVVLWAALPLAAISFGTSKLYHYAYPFLPPLAIGGGVLLATLVPLVDRWLQTALGAVSRRSILHGWLRTLCSVVAIAAFAVAVATLLFGSIDLQWNGVRLFKNGATLRPALVLLVFGLAGGQFDLVRRTVVPLLLLGVLPLPAYRDVFAHLRNRPHPFRSVTRCIADVQRGAAADAGLYVDAPDEDLLHVAFYYFRPIQPWVRSNAPGSADLSRSERPALIAVDRAQALQLNGAIPERTARLSLDKLVLLLPGPYAACYSQAVSRQGYPAQRD